MLFVLILLNLIVITSTTGNWHQLDGIEYYIEYTAVNGVNKAKEGCKAMNAILPVVKSQRIQDYLVRNINTTKLTGWPFSFYIGLSRTRSNALQWSDGTTTDTSVFTYWDTTDGVYDSRKLCVTMGYHATLNVLFKWKIEYCNGNHRYICQRNSPTTTTVSSTSTIKRKGTSFQFTTTAVTTEQSTTEVVSLTLKHFSTTKFQVHTSTKNNSVTGENTAGNEIPSSGNGVVLYAMIGVGAIVVLVICGIIYIKHYRNRKPKTDKVDERNSRSEEDEGPVVVDNVLYGTSAEPIQDLYEEADKVDPVYSCADASASYVVPNVELDPKAAVYDCTPDNASTDNGPNETDDKSREDSLEDVYAQVVKKKKTLKK